MFSLFPLIHIYDVGKGPAQEHASLQTHPPPDEYLSETAAGDLVQVQSPKEKRPIKKKKLDLNESTIANWRHSK